MGELKFLKVHNYTLFLLKETRYNCVQHLVQTHNGVPTTAQEQYGEKFV